MAGREYYLKQAETCLRLARSTSDKEISEKLYNLAAEYQAKARAAENAPPKDSDQVSD